MKRKTLLLLFLVLLAARSVRAQDDTPRFQIGAAYANQRLPDGETTTVRHTGLSLQAGVNLSPWFGVENNFGAYKLGFGTRMITDLVSARSTLRALTGPEVVPYGLVGYGLAHISQTNVRYAQGTVPAVRPAAGVEFRVTPSISARVEVGRMFLRSYLSQSGINGTAGVVFNFR